MSGPIAAALRELMALGVEGQALVDAVGRIEASTYAKDDAAEKRRAYDRDRKRSKSNSTGIPPEKAETDTAPIPPEFHRNSTGNGGPSRVEDITSTSENNLNHTTLHCAWPLPEKPNRAEMDELQAVLREAAGQAIDPTATRLLILAAILALGKSGEGPPCDLEADILPVIRARSASAAKHSVRGWNFYVPAIREARDQRLAGAPKVVAVDFAPRGQSPPSWRAEERKASEVSAEAVKRILARE